MKLTIRPATEDDLPAVVRLFATPDGNARDQGQDKAPLDPGYAAALREMGTDNQLVVAASDAGIVGVFQLTFIRHVAHRGALIAQVEAVYVDPAQRGQGVGEAMMRWAIDEAERRGCYRIQLTSNKARGRAHSFYERLGFVASHVGMKRALGTSAHVDDERLPP
jgi:GNAT superfamily N-acetyltransferase